MSREHHNQPQRDDLRIRERVTRGRPVQLRLDDRPIDANEGESVAAALWAAGIRSCDAREGAGPPSRTLYCAMGTCQQCALWIDGRRVESCMTPVRDDMSIRTRFDATAIPPAHRSLPKEAKADVAIVGAGPAGMAAAIEAASRGLRVVLLDEQAIAGGQVYRVAGGIAPRMPDADRREGDALRTALANAEVDVRASHRVWHVERMAGEWHVHALGPDGALTIRTRALIAATGALERHVPFDGWDQPGVMGLASATILLKAQRVLPGRAVIVAGTGPLLLVVAKSIVESGGRVVAVVDANAKRRWLASARELASRPDLVARGFGWLRMLKRHRVPMLHQHAIRSVTTQAGRLRTIVVPVDGAGRRVEGRELALEADAVCCGYGLMPATDLTRLAGAAHRFDPQRGGWHALVDGDQRCSVASLYVAGDGAGVTGAASAPWQGRIAALSAAQDLKRDGAEALRAPARVARKARDRASRFGLAMTSLANAGDGAIEAIDAATLVCQCESLTRSTLDVAIADGATTLNELRAATRCGMGPCGGRLCEDAAARLIALRTGRPRNDVGQPTGRPPLRPVDLDMLAGDFDYDTLPIAAPSPL
jgi:thioredoxin reductase/bacterioferritin-associated ferredoxin